MNGTKHFTVTGTIVVSEEDVWDYLEYSGEDVEQLKESGYELTYEDYENTAHELFMNDDVEYDWN